MLKELIRHQEDEIHAKILNNALEDIRSVKGLLHLREVKGKRRGEIDLVVDPDNNQSINGTDGTIDSTTFLKVANGIVNGCISELTNAGLKKVASRIMEENYISQKPLTEKQKSFLTTVDEAIERIPA